MKNTRLIIMVLLLLCAVIFTGCGRKTAPVISEKGSISMTGQESIKIIEILKIPDIKSYRNQPGRIV